VVGPERETVAEAETGAAEEYSGGCRYVQSRDERRGGSPACFFDRGQIKGATAGLWFWESRARETVKAGVQGRLVCGGLRVCVDGRLWGKMGEGSFFF
jgi:hypothetical protein